MIYRLVFLLSIIKMYWIIWMLCIGAFVYHIVQLIRWKSLEWRELFFVIIGDIVVVLGAIALFSE